MYKAKITKFIDLENSTKDHRSISGNKASHSFYHVTTMSNNSLEVLRERLVEEFGSIFDSEDNVYYLSIPESLWQEQDCPEHYEATITFVSETPVIL